MDFEQEYQDACSRNTDMHEHLPWISELTKECNHTTELGVGSAQSTRGFLRYAREHHSYEIEPYDFAIEYFRNAKNAGRNVTLHTADTRKIEIAETDLMLVDSYHSYDQVKIELELHANKVRKYILFHDTTTFGDRGQGGENGVWPAIQEFLDANTQWVLVERRTNNNGMTLIKRIG
jgi:hypothetical protein